MKLVELDEIITNYSKKLQDYDEQRKKIVETIHILEELQPKAVEIPQPPLKETVDIPQPDIDGKPQPPKKEVRETPQPPKKEEHLPVNKYTQEKFRQDEHNDLVKQCCTKLDILLS